MHSAEPAHLLDYYARHFRPGMIDLSASSPPRGDGSGERMDYGPPGGLPALRAAIAALYPGLRAEHIVVTNGASEALAATAFALVRPGLRVSAPEAIYPSFREVAARLGGLLVADAAELVVVNNPTVPDGLLVDLRELLGSSEATGIQLVADEVYLDLRPDAPGMPAASLSASAISIGDLSKPPGLGALRIGWAACRDQSVLESIVRSVQLISGGPSVMAMDVALNAVNEYGTRMAGRCSAAEANSRMVYGALVEAGWEVRQPQAGWTFLAYPPQPLRPRQIRSLEEAGIFLMPTDALGFPGGFRMSRFTPVEALRLAIDLAVSPPIRPGTLVVLAKATGHGIGKTRLAAQVGGSSAVELADAFLADTLALAEGSNRNVTIAYTPAGHRGQFASLAPDASLVVQPEGDLGDRITAALKSALDGHHPAVLIGTDTPHLPKEIIDDAFDALGRVALVVGPASDGGFYLLGARSAGSLTGLFEGIEWSTSTVYRQLIANARHLGLAVEALVEFTDIDDAQSLTAALREAAVSKEAPHTRAAAARLGLARS